MSRVHLFAPTLQRVMVDIAGTIAGSTRIAHESPHEDGDEGRAEKPLQRHRPER